MSTTVTTWQEAVLEAGAERGIEALTDIAMAALLDELEILRDDDDLLEAARLSAAANVGVVVQILSASAPLHDLEPPPPAIAFARELARRNVPVGELGRGYQLAQHALWRWAVGEVRRRIDDPVQVAAAVEGLSEASFATGDLFSTAVMRRYVQERERWLRSAEAVRTATVDELLSGAVVDVGAASRRLRYELRQEHQAFVVWAEGEDAAPEATAAAVGGERAVVVGHSVGVVVGWAPAGTLTPRAVAGTGAGVAIGAPGDGVRGFRRSHHEALEARRVARLVGHPPGAAVSYADVALLALLTQDLDQAAAFVTRTLGPLAAGDDATVRLAETLLVVLEEQGSPRRAGHRLDLHENTVAKRLRAVDELLDPASRAPAAELMAALRLAPVLRACGHAEM